MQGMVHYGREYRSGALSREAEKLLQERARQAATEVRKGIWLGASLVLSHPITTDYAYPCICGRLNPHTGRRLSYNACGAEVHGSR